MTTTFAAENTVSLAPRAIGRWLREQRIQRARRLALASLLHMQPGRLDDLGINVGDVHEAFAAQGTAPTARQPSPLQDLVAAYSPRSMPA